MRSGPARKNGGRLGRQKSRSARPGGKEEVGDIDVESTYPPTAGARRRRESSANERRPRTSPARKGEKRRIGKMGRSGARAYARTGTRSRHRIGDGRHRRRRSPLQLPASDWAAGASGVGMVVDFETTKAGREHFRCRHRAAPVAAGSRPRRRPISTATKYRRVSPLHRNVRGHASTWAERLRHAMVVLSCTIVGFLVTSLGSHRHGQLHDHSADESRRVRPQAATEAGRRTPNSASREKGLHKDHKHEGRIRSPRGA